MNTGIFKNIILPSMKHKQPNLYRVLSDLKVSTVENVTTNKTLEAKEDEDALKIEANLFNQSLVQHKPILVKQALRENTICNKKLTFNQPSKHTPKSSLLKKQEIQKLKTESILINDTELGLNFTKLNLNDRRLHSLMITTRSKSRRDKHHQIIVEGHRLIREALERNLHMHTVIFSQKEKLFEIKDEVAQSQKSRQTIVYKVPQHDLKLWSTLSTPPGVIAIFERPSLIESLKKVNDVFPITVVCDNIREPNNLGSIIRSCAALPCFQVITTKGCCDPWETKALRGGCGGHFRLPIRDNIDWKDIPSVLPSDTYCRILIAENNVKKINSRKEEKQIIEYSNITHIGEEHEVLIIGGETHGISAEAYWFINAFGTNENKFIFIPVADGIDSLNVVSALTLILYELRRSILNHSE